MPRLIEPGLPQAGRRSGNIWRQLMRGLQVRVLGLLMLSALLASPAGAATHTPDSASLNAALYPWVDISSTGNALSMTDDSTTGLLPLGFSLSLGGTAYTQARIQSNGMLQFGSTNKTDYTNTALFEGTIPTSLMVFWDDLNPNNGSGGSIRYLTTGTAPNRIFTVSWLAVPFYANAAQKATFQVQLHESGQVVYRYGAINVVNSATIGVNLSATDFTQIAFDQNAAVANGTTIVWTTARTPSAEYLFNQDSWAGVSNEVTDTGPSARHGMAASLSLLKPSTATTSPAASGSPGTCAYGNFARASKDHILLPASFPNLGSSSGFTASLWLRSSDVSQPTQRILVDDENNSGGYGLSLSDGGTGRLRFYSRGTGASTALDTPVGAALQSNVWYFVAFGVNTATKVKFIIVLTASGSLHTSATATYTTSTFGSDAGTVSIGGETNASGENTATYGFNGQIDEVRVHDAVLTLSQLGSVRALTSVCIPPLHHLEIRHGSGTGVTCAPSTLTVAACQDANCTTPFTNGLTGTLTATGIGTVLWTPSFTIPAGASTVNVSIQLVNAGSTVLGSAATAPAAANPTSCNFGSPSCTYSAADSALLASVPSHVADTPQTVTIQAVRKSDNSAQCVPAFANLNRSVAIGCRYANPASAPLLGASTVRVNNAALAACNGSGPPVALAFNASGVASATVQYADAGQMTLDLRYDGSVTTGDPSLTILGSTNFVAAPARFAFTGLPTAAVPAGTAFTASLGALNASNNSTPNFGRETTAPTVVLSHALRQPTGTGAQAGSFTGTVGAASAGVMALSNLMWTEVGRIDLLATMSNYLSSGLGASGSTGSTGAVLSKPHHFTLGATPGCGIFSYSGQASSITLTAWNGLVSPAITLNYDGSTATSPNFARSVSYSDAQALGDGSFSGTGVNATAFLRGQAMVTSGPAYTFTNKLSLPRNLVLRSIDSDGVSSAGTTEPSVLLRSGRLRVFNAFGSEKAALALPVQAEFWSGKAWVLNDADSCTVVPAAAVGRAQYVDHLGATRAAWGGTDGSITIAGGHGALAVPAPPAGSTGSIDIALNLGSTALDTSCLTSHPNTTGASLSWLRARHGSCPVGWGGDPWARATFGVNTAREQKRTVHVREVF